MASPSEVACDLTSTIYASIISSRRYVQNLRSTLDFKSLDGKPVYYMYNSTLAVAPNGRILAHYRKTHLYYTDATWALPSPTGFTASYLHFKVPPSSRQIEVAVERTDLRETPGDSTPAPSESPKTLTSFGICMDMNPQYFTASWKDYELANYTLKNRAPLLVISTAWLTRLPPAGEDISNESHESVKGYRSCCSPSTASQPDLDSFSYWIDRLSPLLDADRDTLVVVANRVGVEPGAVRSCDLENPPRRIFGESNRSQSHESRDSKTEKQKEVLESHPGAEPAAPKDADDKPATESSKKDRLEEFTRPITHDDSTRNIVTTFAHYAGTSAVFTLGHGKIHIWGLLGRGEEGVLVADTETKAENIWSLKPRDISPVSG